MIKVIYKLLKTSSPCSVCKCFSFCTVKSICMTKWVVTTPPIIFFIFEKQFLNFWTCVVIQVFNLCFQNFRQNFTFFITFCKKFRFWSFQFFQYFFKLSIFFMATVPIDSMKMRRKPSRLRCSFKFFGRKKGISHSLSILINS